ncbi:MAG: hypothetical protein EZS28_007487 [Streblomastix strix]|uniref:Uncharacterized protein n=1 Tax=Streblomastix strix TaxID=222440 RepID=A0A5J4WQ40_9EUKA|nr:MAG: hypothetical protein EZS28_007487 [Streblomastix strix]
MADQIPKPKQPIRRSKSFDHHLSVLVPYEQDKELIIENSGTLQDVGMTKFAKQPQNDGSFIGSNSLANRQEGKLERKPSADNLLLSSFTQKLRNKLDDIERQQAKDLGSSPKLTRKSTKDYMEYPKKEKGTLREKITEFFTQAKPTTIDFSAVPINDPKIRGVNWGASGPPATLGLGAKGIQKSPKDIIKLQQRQERLLSKSSTYGTMPAARKITNSNNNNLIQGSQVGQNMSPTSPPLNHGMFQSISTPTLSPNKASKQQQGPLSPLSQANAQQQGPYFSSQESISNEQDASSPSAYQQSTPPQKDANQDNQEDWIQQMMKRFEQMRSDMNQIV